MSKYNKSSSEKTTVANYMGGKSFRQTEKEELAFAVVSSFMEDSYYESGSKRVARIAKLVAELAKDDALFIAKLAIITRREFHMRSAFHVLLGELVKNHRGDSLVSETLSQAVERPDDLLEIAAYVGKPLPKQVKKGIANSIHKFDPYQLAKYRGEGKDFSLVDLMNLVHPKPIDEKENKAWRDLIEGRLKSTETWEAKLSSEEGREDKAGTWKDLVLSGKLGYMALLRNLRNIAQECDVKTIRVAARTIADPDLVRKSKQLPFRFLSAYEALGAKSTHVAFEGDADKYQILRDAVEKALTVSCQNLPDLPGRTIILSDNSGSMTGDRGGGSPLSAMSNRKTADIANLFATMYWMKAENTFVGVFGDELIQPKMDREKSLFDNYSIVSRAGGRVGPGTEAGIFAMFDKLIDEKTKVDRIIIFSDCQVGKGCEWYTSGFSPRQGADFNKLFHQVQKLNPQSLTYCVDLKGYGNTLFSDGVLMLSGWSDKIFSLMENIEKKEGLVKWIENYPVPLPKSQ